MQFIYQTFLKPRSALEDDRRREFILNVLLIGTIFITFTALVSTILEFTLGHTDQKSTAPLAVGTVSILFPIMLILSRRGYYKHVAYCFVIIFFTFATFPFVQWGIQLPQGVLTYALIIVITGVLINSANAFRMALLMTAVLIVIKNLESRGIIEFYSGWKDHNGSYDDILVYGATFMIVALVSWLSNREIERSLRRARRSEQELRVERNSLEVKVQERTKDLEQTQLEKIQELNRFAEFGRVSSALLHELANPLTSMSLNIDQLENKQQSKLLSQVRESITFMEQYVNNARRQLRKQSDIRSFNSAEEIMRVIKFITPKARGEHIKLQYRLAKNVTLLGDSVRFSQVITNLLLNAIDAYAEVGSDNKRLIEIHSKKIGHTLQISVSDQGKGIPKAQQKRVFDAFFTTKTSDRGTGLGLTITKQTVEQDFRGKIEVMGAPNSGTTFTINLPLP